MRPSSAPVATRLPSGLKQTHWIPESSFPEVLVWFSVLKYFYQFTRNGLWASPTHQILLDVLTLKI